MSFKKSKIADRLLMLFEGNKHLERDHIFDFKDPEFRIKANILTKILVDGYVVLNEKTNKYHLKPEGFYIISDIKNLGYLAVYKRRVGNSAIMVTTLIVSIISLILQFNSCETRENNGKSNTNNTIEKKTNTKEETNNKNYPLERCDTTLKSSKKQPLQ